MNVRPTEPGRDNVHAEFDCLLDSVEDILSTVAAYLDDAREYVVAFANFPGVFCNRAGSMTPTVDSTGKFADAPTVLAFTPAGTPPSASLTLSSPNRPKSRGKDAVTAVLTSSPNVESTPAIRSCSKWAHR